MSTARLDAPPGRPVPTADVVIDLTGAPPSRRTAHPRRGLIALTVLIGVLAAVAGGLAARNYAAAIGWQDRARLAEQRASRAEADAGEARAEAAAARRDRRLARQRRSALADQLAASEADVAALEARVVALASDRARAQDLGGAAAAATPDAIVRALQAQVDSCVAEVEAVRSGLIVDAGAEEWQQALSGAQATCEQVAADVDALVTGRR